MEDEFAFRWTEKTVRGSGARRAQYLEEQQKRRDEIDRASDHFRDRHTVVTHRGETPPGPASSVSNWVRGRAQ